MESFLTLDAFYSIIVGFQGHFPELDDSTDDDVHEALAGFAEAGEFFKMVFVVNQELNMGVGKVAAQVCV